MSITWDYTKLSALAKTHGGPENLLKIVTDNSLKRGIKIGTKAGIYKMLPLTIGALGLGILGTIGYQKWQEHRKTKLAETLAATSSASEAEEALIQIIKETIHAQDQTQPAPQEDIEVTSSDEKENLSHFLDS